MANLRDLKWLDSLSKRDFENQAVIGEIRSVFKSCAAMRAVLADIYEEFDGRYDGAPDAEMQWMGYLMCDIERALALSQPLAPPTLDNHTSSS